MGYTDPNYVKLWAVPQVFSFPPECPDAFLPAMHLKRQKKSKTKQRRDLSSNVFLFHSLRSVTSDTSGK